MTLRDIKDNVGAFRTLSPQTITADVNGVGVDTRGFDSAMAVVIAGAIAAAGLVLPVLQESDDDVTYNDVAAADLQGAFVNLTADSIQRVGYAGAKRYIRVKADYISGTSVIVAASIEVSHAHIKPVA